MRASSPGPGLATDERPANGDGEANVLVGMDVLLRAARDGGYAVGSFDVNNIETTMGVLEAAVEKQSPVIISYGDGGVFGVLPMEVLMPAIRALAEPLPIPVAVLLDHGRTVETCVRAIRSGATSVMYDGSVLPFAENVENTRLVVRLARAVGVAVEAEVGHVVHENEAAEGSDDAGRLLTRPEEAAEFVRLTGVDALAVAVGTVHGVYSGRAPAIDYDRLTAISRAVPVPLVIHGGSGTGEERLAKAIACGVAKVNIYTDMALAAKRRIQSALEQAPESTRLTDILAAAKDEFKAVAARYMDVFGSAGKA